MDPHKPSPRKPFFTILFLSFGLMAASSFGHNQNPATIRRAMNKAFRVLESPLPSNVFKGQHTLRVAGATAQIFEASKNEKNVGRVAQVEIQELVYVIAVGSDGLVKSVIRDGSAIESDEWTSLAFVEEIRKSLSPSKSLAP